MHKILALLLFVVTLTGCQSRDEDQAATRDVNLLEQLTDTQQAQKERAIGAKDALFETLLGELTSTMSSQGPVKAIPVCKRRAPEIAKEVSADHQLKIGRTSWQLRNPENQPPLWAEPLVANKVEQPQMVGLPGETLGVLLPIRMKATCTMCHGDRKDLLPDVKAALAGNYPDDEATGFAEGDLRGYFWVEVPPGE